MVEIAEGAFRHTVAEVGAPTSDHRVEPAQQVGERAMRCPPGQPSHLVDDRSQRLLRRVGVDVAFPGLVTFLAATLDAPAEEVEPVVYVGQPGLGLRQAQAIGCNTAATSPHSASASDCWPWTMITKSSA